MALKIYESASPGSAYSTDSSYSAPLSLSFDGINGGYKYVKLYLRNDDPTYYYTGITIQPVMLSGTSIIDGTNGWSWKLKAGDTQPLEAEWDLLTDANSISMADLGSSGTPDTNTYLPFWLRIEIPAGAEIKAYQNVTLRKTANEVLV